MSPHSYKVVNTNDHEISGWKILSRPLHLRALHLGGMNGDDQPELYTLTFNNGEQVEFFRSRIIVLQQEIILSGENISPTRLIFQYTKEFSYRDKIKVFIAPKMTDLITFLDNNIK